MMTCKKIISAFLLLVTFATANTQTKTSSAVMKGFMDKRFGMFVHWGPVTLRGTEIGWSRDNQVNIAEYDSLYKEFDPVLFNADKIVKTAKDAGMKYLTITARHHDGFCLWPTANTNYNIMSTPYKKDIVGGLNEACKKQGLKFCIYYSVLDWYHPDYPIHSSRKESAVDPKADMNRYIIYMKNQLKELITNYNPYMLWFDGNWESPWTLDMAKDMYAYIKKLSPDVIINNRLGKEMAGVENKKIDYTAVVGDYDTPEQTVGRLNLEIPWESCFTICNQWSWKSNDNMKSLTTCLKILSQTAGGNGNLLLNVGPMPDGRIEERQTTRLKEMGNWLKINGEAIYNTWGGPYQPNDNYATTRKGNKIYLHVIKTDTASITLKNIPDRKIVKAYTIEGENISIENGNGTFTAMLLLKLAGKMEYIIVLELDGDSEAIQVIN